MSSVDRVVLRSPEGVEYAVSFDGESLWIHVRQDGPSAVVIDRFELNAANEGWLHVRKAARVQSQSLPVRPVR